MRHRLFPAVTAVLAVVALSVPGVIGLSSGALAAPTPAVAPSPSSGWLQVAVGADGSTCAVKSAGTLWCWGVNMYGQLGDGSTLDRPTPIRVGPLSSWASVSRGPGTSCAIRTDASLWCWGDNYFNQLGLGYGSDLTKLRPQPVAAGLTWSSVAVGADTTCAIRTEGTLWCWGSNGYGQLGNGSLTPSALPDQVGTATDWTSVSTSGLQTCAIRSTGGLWCWGYNQSGELGVGNTTNQVKPAPVGPGTRWATVSTGVYSTCGVQTNHTLWCWGANTAGRLKTNQIVPTPTQVDTATNWASVSANGNLDTCAAKTDGSLLCWGQALTNGTPRASFSPGRTPLTAVGSYSNSGSSDPAAAITCAVRADSSLTCFGLGSTGQLGAVETLGDGSVFTSSVLLQPTAVADANPTWRQVSAAPHDTCGIRTDDSLWCWGEDAAWQLGRVGPGTQLPGRVGTAANWSVVSAGRYDTCGTQTNGTLWCWGGNSMGQLGDGTTTSQRLPTQVGATAAWSSVSAGHFNTCAIRTDGTLWCWGENTDGQLGDGTTTARTLPTQVGTDTTWRSVTAGDRHTCALRTDGSLWCWGLDNFGQLGNGVKTARSATPTMVSATSPWTAVTLGATHTCALHADQTLWCWGDNRWGQLGITNRAAHLLPTRVAGTSWTSVSTSATWSGTCATRANGSLWCWGNNLYGALGQLSQGIYVGPQSVDDQNVYTTVSTSDASSCAILTTGGLACWGKIGSIGSPSIRFASVS